MKTAEEGAIITKREHETGSLFIVQEILESYQLKKLMKLGIRKVLIDK